MCYITAFRLLLDFYLMVHSSDLLEGQDQEVNLILLHFISTEQTCD